jgi:N-acetylglucosaminyl-diphospho-decaprenol L-rhamnosyltransferase
MPQTLAPTEDALASGPWSVTTEPAWPETPIAPDVSVCIANWNCRDYLRACLDSLLNQPQGASVEVIVADNGSADGAADMVAAEFPEVILVRNQDNLGFAHASNQAATRASGRHIFFLNNDTIVPPLALGRLVEFADMNPHVGMIGPRLRDGEGKLQISYRRLPTLRAMLHRASVLRWTGLFRSAYDAYRRDGFDPDGIRRVEVLMGRGNPDAACGVSTVRRMGRGVPLWR